MGYIGWGVSGTDGEGSQVLAFWPIARLHEFVEGYLVTRTDTWIIRTAVIRVGGHSLHHHGLTAFDNQFVD
jgi:hypothetical protein